MKKRPESSDSHSPAFRSFGGMWGHVHFIGIGGVSMYSLARLTLKLGARVSGSDREDSDRLRELSLLGAEVHIGHSAEWVEGAELVVYSQAIDESNPERTEADRRGINLISRSEYLGMLMLNYSRRIGVSGSHGKSSTTALLDCIFSRAGTDPTTLSGAELPIGEPMRLGGRELLIYEACEYRDSFLDFSPTASVYLNLELDHTDYFENIDALKRSFSKSLKSVADFAVINGDDPNLAEIKESARCRIVTFGSGEHNDYRYSITSFEAVGYRFALYRFGNRIGEFSLGIPGSFNLSNATAAIVTAIESGVDIGIIRDAVASFSGIPRRLEHIGARFGRPVYYDYAHHPTEIEASINALRLLTGRPITVIFKPHTFSRTKALWREFISSLSMADSLVLCEIYPARERPIEGVTSEALARAIGSSARFCTDREIIEYIDLHTEGTIVLMGAGDLENIRKRILKGS